MPAVPEDGRPVTQGEDLVQPVAHEQDRHAAVAEPADDREQPLDLVGRQRCGRLVEDQRTGVYGEGLGDLDQLLVRHRQAPDRGADIELDVELGEQRLCRPAHAPPVDGAQDARRCVADEHVLGDGEVREQSRFLVNHGDAERAGLGGPVDQGGHTLEQDRAAVRLVDAGQDLDQGALAGTVLADQAVDLAGAQVHRDVGQGGCRSE